MQKLSACRNRPFETHRAAVDDLVVHQRDLPGGAAEVDEPELHPEASGLAERHVVRCGSAVLTRASLWPAHVARTRQMNSDTAASRISAIAVAAPIGSSSPSIRSSRFRPSRSIVIWHGISRTPSSCAVAISSSGFATW